MSEKVEISNLGIFEAQVFCIAQIDCDGALTDSAYFADKLGSPSGSWRVLAEVGKFWLKLESSSRSWKVLAEVGKF